MGRRAGLASLIVLAVLVAALAAALAYRTRLAEALLINRLRAMGIPVAALTVAELGANRARIAHLALGDRDELGAESIILDYRWRELLTGRVRRVTIDGLAARLDLSGNGPPLGSLRFPASGGGGGGLTLPPIDLAGARVEALTPLGKVAAEFDGELRAAGRNAISATLSFRLEGPFGHLAGLAGLRGDPRARLAGQLVIDDGALRRAPMHAGGISGTVGFDLLAGALDRLGGAIAIRALGANGLAFRIDRLAVELTSARLRLDGTAHADDGDLEITARLDLDDYRTAPRLSLDLVGKGAVASLPANQLGFPQPRSGAGRLAIAATGKLPPIGDPGALAAAPLAWLDHGSYEGQVRLALESIRFAGNPAALSGEATIEGRYDESAWTLALPQGAVIGLSGVKALLNQTPTLPAELISLVGDHTKLSLSDSDGRPFRAELQPTAAGYRIALGGAGRLALSGGIEVAAAADARLALGDKITLQRLDLRRFHLTGHDLDAFGQRIDELALTASGSGGSGHFSGNGRARLSLPEAKAGALAARAVTAALDGEVEIADGALRIALADGGEITAGALSYGDGIETAGPVRLGLRGGRLRLALPGRPRADKLFHSFALAPDPIELRLASGAGGGEPTRVIARLDNLAIEGRIDSGGSYRGRLAIAGADIELPDQMLTATDLSAKLAFDLARSTAEGRFDLGALRETRDDPLFAPLDLAGEVHIDGAEVTATANGTDRRGVRRLTLTGRHDLANGVGTARLRLAPIPFAPNDIQPGDLIPALATLRDVKGTVEAGAELAWTPAGVDGTASLHLGDLGFAAAGLDIEGLHGEIAFDRLLPPRTPPGQRVTVARVTGAVPLGGVDLRFHLPGGEPPRIAVERARVEMAGGRIVIADTELALGARERALTLMVEDVDIAPLLALLGVEGIFGEGTLGGEIPLRLADGRIAIAGGHLKAKGPGQLTVRSEAARRVLAGRDESVDLLIDALEDFRFEDLSIEIDKPLSGAATLRLRLSGRNPAVGDGQPFDLNIALETDLDKLLAAAGEATRLSGAVLRRAGIGRGAPADE